MKLPRTILHWPRRWAYLTIAAVSSLVPFVALATTGVLREAGLWLGMIVLMTALFFASIGFGLGRREENLILLSLKDPLTGLWNRAALADRLEEEINRASRSEQPLALLLVDLDHLKPINDELGHAAGDAAIIRVADCIRAACRGTDVAARHGGDEFAILVPGADATQAATLAERIRAGVEAFPLNEAGANIGLSVSIGVVDVRPHANMTPATVLQAADFQLYKAKAAGQNRVAVHDFTGNANNRGSRSHEPTLTGNNIRSAGG